MQVTIDDEDIQKIADNFATLADDNDDLYEKLEELVTAALVTDQEFMGAVVDHVKGKILASLSDERRSPWTAELEERMYVVMSEEFGDLVRPFIRAAVIELAGVISSKHE